MTLLNWIGLGATTVILGIGILFKLKWHKKVESLDGFCGITKKHQTKER